jgi:hypothetical protein
MVRSMLSESFSRVRIADFDQRSINVKEAGLAMVPLFVFQALRPGIRTKYYISMALTLILIPVSLPLMLYARPLYVFYWGENIKLIDKREDAGKFLLVGIVLAILLSVISSFIYDAIK